MNKIFSLLGAFGILFSMALPAFAGFSDIDQATSKYDLHGYKEAIDYVENQGIVNGYPDGTYRPQSPINRAEFTKIIINSYFSTDDIINCDRTQLNFPDVPQEAWFTPYVCVAFAEGIIQGFPDGSFKPEQEINFVEGAKIIAEADSANGQFLKTIDPQDPTDPWYKRYVDYLSFQIPLDIISFNHKLTRGEMAEIIHRVRENISGSSQSYESIRDEAYKNFPPHPQVGQKYGNFTLEKINPSRVADTFEFSGEATVFAEFESFLDGGYFINEVCLSNVRQEDKDKLPSIFENNHICLGDDPQTIAEFGGKGARGYAQVTLKDFSAISVKVPTGGFANQSTLLRVDKLHYLILPESNNVSKLYSYDSGITMKIPNEVFTASCQLDGQVNGKDAYLLQNRLEKNRFYSDPKQVATLPPEIENYYLSPLSSATLSQETTENGQTFYQKCEYRGNDYKKLADLQQNPDSNDFSPVWNIKYLKVSDEQELNQFVKKIYGEGCKAATQTPTTQANTFRVTIDAEQSGGNISFCSLPSDYVLFYSSGLQRAVTWTLDPNRKFVDKQFMDQQKSMIDSFEFFNPFQ